MPSLQENGMIFPTEISFWNHARIDLRAAVKGKLQAEHVKTLIDKGHTPKWSLGLKPLPDFLKPFVKDMTCLKRQQAVDLMQLAHRKLAENTKQNTDTAEVLLAMVKNIYCDQRNDQPGWQFAQELIITLVNIDKNECAEELEKSLQYIHDHPVLDVILTQLLVNESKPKIDDDRTKKHEPKSKTRRHRQWETRNNEINNRYSGRHRRRYRRRHHNGNARINDINTRCGMRHRC